MFLQFDLAGDDNDEDDDGARIASLNLRGAHFYFSLKETETIDSGG